MSSVQSSTYASSTAAKSSSSSSSTLQSQDQFLALLVAQLKAQDPLNPMDNAQMTSQLAQISTVQGIETLNKTVTALMGQMDAVDQLNATALIGHTVLVDGSRIELSHTDEGTAVAGGGITLDAAATNVKVEVRDANGALVRTIDLGSLEAGNHVFSWDGKSDAGADLVDGQYSFKVTAANNGKSVESTALAFARVDGVLRDANGVLKLDLGGLGLFEQDEIRQIF